MQLEAFRRTVAALNQADVRFILVGGMAVVAHGYGRMTIDMDLVIQLTPDNIVRTFDALGSLRYAPRTPVTAKQFADPKLRDGWARDKGMVVLSFFSDQFPRMPVDVFVQAPFAFDLAYEKASVEQVEPNQSFRFADIATLIQMKERTGREKDLDDVQHLRIIQNGQG